MADLDALVREAAAGLMLDAARGVSLLQVRNCLGGHEDLADLGDGEFEGVLQAVLEAIETADITIDFPGR